VTTRLAPTTELLASVRSLIRTSADDRIATIRDNLRAVMRHTDHDPVAIQALTGLSAGTVRNFLSGTDSSIGNVVLIALALGVTLGDLERSPLEFGRMLSERRPG
jgi:hypothetical protein